MDRLREDLMLPQNALGETFPPTDLVWPSFALQHYIQALIVSPLVVVETLADVQLQPQNDDHDPDQPYSDQNDQNEQLPRIPADLPRSIRIVADSPHDGISALLKGHFTDFAFRAAFAAMQPACEELLNDVLDVYEDANAATFVLSHAIAGAVLSPLELARTRLAVQSSAPSFRRYYGPIHTLYAVAAEERPSASSGILSTLYSPRILIPSILVHAIGPCIRFFSARFIQDDLGLDPAFTPFLYRVAVLGFLAIEAAVITPIEIARKRLQIQRINVTARRARVTKPPADAASPDADPTDAVQAFETSVQTPTTPYTGILNCIASIIATEGGNSPASNMRKRASQSTNLSDADWQDIYGGGPPQSPSPPSGLWASASQLGKGFCSLYRGFWARYTATVVLYMSSEITRDDTW